jgi:predicted RNA-binding Zn ribbon-like protein
MIEIREGIQELELVGGRLSLDFANTIEDVLSNDPQAQLDDYLGLVEWSVHAESASEEEALLLQERARQQPAAVAPIVERSQKLREAIYRILMAITSGEVVPQPALTWLNEELARAMPHVQLVADEEGFHWHWERNGALDSVLWPVVEDAADLLTAGSLERVKQCDGHGCDWLFLDTSRNRSRRWCSMETCGNRAKARRFYHRHQDEDEE